MKKYFVFISCLFALSAFAAQDTKDSPESKVEKATQAKRKSKIKLAVFSGRDRYRESELSAGLGLDPVWLLTGSISGEKSDGVQTATAFSVGANAQITQDFDASISLLSHREPDSVIARGLSVGINWNLASFWNAEEVTELGIQTTFMRYKQDDGLRTRVRDGGIKQNSLNLSLSQELNEKFQVHGAFTAYGLGGADANELSQAISDRLNLNPGFLQVVQGFPKRSYGLGLDYQAGENLILGADLFKTDYFNGTLSRGLALTADYDVTQEWTLGVGVSGSSTGSGNSRNGLLELSVAYRF